MRLTFNGAARIVTGSCYLLEVGNEKILVDCGMFQGNKDTTRRNYEDFRFDPRKLDCMLLTHAHIDHSGLIPKLARSGYRSPIYATSATIDLCKVMLEDSAGIQVSETEQENRRRARQGLPPREPLYSPDDAKAAFPLFRKAGYNEMIQVTRSVRVRYRNAGHILGSAIIEVFVREGPDEKKIVFSGDLGQWTVPIINDPEIIDSADYLVVESTYGNSLHEKSLPREELLLKYIKETYDKGGKLLIPCFAVERTQEILYALNNLKAKLPKEKVYLDSPLAIKATEVFRRHRECYDPEALKIKDPFSFPALVNTPKVEDSIRLNTSTEPCMVLAGDGMCTAGRIRHHFKHGLWDQKNTVLFVGYQAEGTLGRYILEGAREVRMMGLQIVVKADIRKISSFSAHADYEDIMTWAKGFRKKPLKTFVVHGEPAPALALSERLEKEGFSCRVPELQEKADL